MSARAETFVVLQTAIGRGAVASLLVAGPNSAKIVGQYFQPAAGKSLESFPLDRIVFGQWQTTGGNEQIVVCRRTEDRIEVHCHGGRAAAAAIIAALVAQGCRELDWQAWLRRTNDPITAEAQIALAAAPTERAALVLLDQQSGALRRAIDEIAKCVAAGDASAALRGIDELLRWSACGLHLVQPWKVVLAGRPNVGKSSLINALVGYTRAIVHATPGTTRDVVTAAAAIDGWPIELADTAGLRNGADPLEAEGIERARRQLRAADLVVLVFDSSVALSSDDDALLAEWPQALRVFSKCDLPPLAPMAGQGIRTSALAGQGIDELIQAIARRLVPQAPPPGQAMPFLPAHVEALTVARRAIAAGDLAAARTALTKLAC